MIKYVESLVTFSEVPDEISLCINISGCQIRCPDCHSSYLWENIGKNLTESSLRKLIKKNSGITTVCFMGGDQDIDYVISLAKVVKTLGLKTARYSGKKTVDPKEYKVFDYIKYGPYIKELGPLNSPTTNQKMEKIELTGNNQMWVTDITYKFQKNNRK